MNPVEIGAGKSFKGLARYILHDKGQDTTERVGWVQSYNLDEADGDRAWRLMAATAMSADKLKAAAGIKKGKAAKNVAWHLSLNFNPDDRPSEAVQRAAVTGALKALGLDQHQALAASHHDTDKLHLHVMVNLISPENGLSAASKQPGGKAALLSNTQRKLSAWAAAFEREHGLEVTQGRIVNAEKRAQGEKVDAKRVPRNVYERRKAETADRRRDYIKRRFDQSARQLADQGRTQRAQHGGEWDELKARYQAQRAAIRDAADKRVPRIIAEVKERNRPRWAALYMRQRSEAEDFTRDEKSVIGRVWHGMAVFRERAKDADALGGFLAAFSPDARRAIIERKHTHEQAAARAAHKAQVGKALDAMKAERAVQYRDARTAYLAACGALRARQARERVAGKAAWKAHNDARRTALVSGARPSPVQALDQQQRRGRGLSLRLKPE